MSAAEPDCWQRIGTVISAMLARTYPNHEFEEFTGVSARPADTCAETATVSTDNVT